jgi:hypothetical protein
MSSTQANEVSGPSKAQGEAEPATWQWAAFDSEGQRTAWHPEGTNEHTKWLALAEQHPDEYAVRRRPLFTQSLGGWNEAVEACKAKLRALFDAASADRDAATDQTEKLKHATQAVAYSSALVEIVRLDRQIEDAPSDATQAAYWKGAYERMAARNAEIARELSPWLAAHNALKGFEAEYGNLPDDHELGRIEESAVGPSFRIRAGHVRRLADIAKHGSLTRKEEPRAGDPCLAKKLVLEPSFTLLGRDPQAPGLVRQWAVDRERAEGPSEKVENARQIAFWMDAFKDINPDLGMSRDLLALAASEPGIPAGWQKAVERGSKAAALLLQNAEGCAANHHAIDFAQQGTPGWLIDARKDVEALSALLAASAPGIPAGRVAKLEGELKRVTDLLEHAAQTPGYGQDENSREEVEAYLERSRALLAASEPQGDGWRDDMDNAPRGRPIQVEMPYRGKQRGAGAGCWVATAILHRFEDEGPDPYECASILHYNGDVLQHDFRGPLRRWRELPSPPALQETK